MAPLLLGSAATGLGGAFGIGAAATTGLVGTAGAFSLATAATTAATGLGVLGTIRAGQGADADAISRQNLANFNAQVQKQEAIAKRTGTKFASKRQADAAARIKGSQKVNIAAAGGTGSPVAEDLAAEQASELELENLLIGFEGEVAATQAERQGALDIAGGKAARKRGKNLKTASRIQVGTTLLRGFA
jgi:hypothetical protein